MLPALPKPPKPKQTCPNCGKELLAVTDLAKHQATTTCQKKAHTRAKSGPVAPRPLLPKSLTEILQEHSQGTPLIDFVHKGARNAAAERLTAVLKECMEENDLAAWQKFLTFAYCALHEPPPDTGNKTSYVKKSVARLELPPILERKERKAVKSDEATARAAKKKINHANVKAGVRILSSEESIAPNTPETLASLREKHPPAPADLSLPAPPNSTNIQQHDVTADEVLHLIREFPNGSAAGPDGLSPQHLKDLACGMDGSAVRLRECLARLLVFLLSAKLPSEIIPFIYGADLTALLKMDGGIRPIAVGNTVRRLLGKFISQKVVQEMGDDLRPLQLGYGTPGGAEATVHAVRQFIMQESVPASVLLKLDLKNAFNTIRRDRLLEVVQATIPAYYPAIWQMYATSSHLFYREHLLSSATGVQQGDPLGPLLFCLAIKRMGEQLSSPLKVLYLDDGTLGGDADTVADDLSSVQRGAERLGMSLNMGKCELFTFGGDEVTRELAAAKLLSVSPLLKRPTREELCLLGSPLLPEGIPAALEEKRMAAERLTGRLRLLGAHQGLFILKNCLAIPKVLYVLRTAPTWLFPESLRQFDETIRLALERITNVKMTVEVQLQAAQPVRFGGLGVRRVEELSLPAYLASAHSTFDLVESITTSTASDLPLTAAAAWMSLLPSAILPEIPERQRQWDEPLCAARLSLLKDQARLLPAPHNLFHLARLHAIATPESGCWLNALPSSAVGNLLDDHTLRIAVALRLGADICKEHRCECGKMVQANGYHGLSCNKQAGRIPRHNALNDIICRSLSTAGYNCMAEPVGLCVDDEKRPDGITLMPWSHGRQLCHDVTVVDTFADVHIMSSSGEAGKAADAAEAQKDLKYAELLDRFQFSAFGLETMGSWGKAARKLVAEIGRRLTARTGEKRATEFLRQRLSITLQRGNAASVLGTFKGRGLEELFYVVFAK